MQNLTKKNVIVGPKNDSNLCERLYLANQCRGEYINDVSHTKIFTGHYEYIRNTSLSCLQTSVSCYKLHFSMVCGNIRRARMNFVRLYVSWNIQTNVFASKHIK